MPVKPRANRSTGKRMALSITMRLSNETGFLSSFAKWLKGLKDSFRRVRAKQKTAAISKA
jgi:hypothetical protein